MTEAHPGQIAERIFEELDKRFEPGPPVAILGADNLGGIIHRALTRAGHGNLFFLDDVRTDAVNIGLPHVPVYRPGQEPVAEGDRATLPVVIAVGLSPMRRIALRLAERGYRRIHAYLALVRCYREELGDLYWIGDPAVAQEHSGHLARVADLWADPASRDDYARICRVLTAHSWRDLPEPSRDPQYLPADIPGWPGRLPMRVVDAGAYIGDTLDSLAGSGHPIESYLALEPDRSNHAALVQALTSHSGRFSGLALPCALTGSLRMVHFDDGRGKASRLASAEGGTAILGLDLDSLVVAWNPTLIKMDIEGAEVDALNGGAAALQRHRPALAICMYHDQRHFWEIPELVHRLLPMHRLHLRVHGHCLFETVLYAVPPEGA